MSPLQRGLVGLAVGAALTIGVKLLTSADTPPPEPDSAPPSSSPSPPEAPPNEHQAVEREAPDGPPPHDDDPDDAARVAEQLDRELAWLRAQLEAWEGAPRDWPADLPAHLDPDSVSDAVTDAVAEAGGTLHGIDCSEFPCLALFDLPPGDDHYTACVGLGRAAMGEDFAFAFLTVGPTSQGGIRCSLAPGRKTDNADEALRERLDLRNRALLAEGLEVFR